MEILMEITAAGLAIVLVIFVPLMAVAKENDRIAMEAIEAELTNFVNDFASKGESTQEDYDEFVQKVQAIMPCEIEISIRHLDDNPGRKNAQTSGNLIGENLTWTTFDYKETIGAQGKYEVNKGDQIDGVVYKTQLSFSDAIENMWYKVLGKNISKEIARSSALVIN